MVLIIVAHNELYTIVHTLYKIMFYLCFQNTILVIIVKLCFENMILQIIKHDFDRVTIIALVSSTSIVLWPLKKKNSNSITDTFLHNNYGQFSNITCFFLFFIFLRI